ncbi:unnamed protein product [Meloidogyne enterolobii]|uniref:Uncharacterized protein n=1 Tax=Meloidogyne enterolobii TaxID=390850 RepID=A0ACB0ZPS7_MELEN
MDIKPHNFVISLEDNSDSRIIESKLIDFSTSVYMDMRQEEVELQGKILGTEMYIAPEIKNHHEKREPFNVRNFSIYFSNFKLQSV